MCHLVQSYQSSYLILFFFFSSRRRHTRCLSDWSSDVCSSDLNVVANRRLAAQEQQQIEQRVRVLAARHAHHHPVVFVEQSEVADRGAHFLDDRSEERRVGKECRSRWSPDSEQKRHSVRRREWH